MNMHTDLKRMGVGVSLKALCSPIHEAQVLVLIHDTIRVSSVCSFKLAVCA